MIWAIDFLATSIASGPYKDVAGTPQFSSPEWWKTYIAQKRLKSSGKPRPGHKRVTLSEKEIQRLENYTWDGSESEVWNLGIILFTMLHIELPFKDYKEIIGLDVRTRIASNVSVLAYDLICKLLDKDRKKRVTFEEVFQHPWLRE